MRVREPPHLDRVADLRGHQVPALRLTALRDRDQVAPAHPGTGHSVVPDSYEEVGRFPEHGFHPVDTRPIGVGLVEPLAGGGVDEGYSLA